MFRHVVKSVLVISVVILSTSIGFSQNTPSSREGWDLYYSARAMVNQAKTQEDNLAARAKFEEALKTFESARDQRGVGYSLYEIASVEERLRNYSTALEYYQRALQLERNIGNKEREGNILNAIGSLYKALGDHHKAIAFFDKSLEMTRKMGDEKREATILNHIGEVYRNRGQNPRSLDCHEKSLMIARKIRDAELESSALRNIGLTYTSMGLLEKALESYEQALDSAKRTMDANQEVAILTGIGLFLNQMGRHQEALENYKKALELVRTSGMSSGEAIVLSSMSLVYLKMGRDERAIEHYEKALEISRRVGDLSQEATMLSTLARLYDINLGQHEKALDYYDKSLEISRKIGDATKEGSALNSIGSIYNTLGQYDKAVEYYQKALEIYRKAGNVSEEATTLNDLGGVFENRSQYERALEFHEKALETRKRIGDTGGESVSLNDIGWVCYHLGQYRKALEYYEKSLEISRAMGNLSLEGTTLSNMGLVFQEWGKSSKAIECHEKSLEIRKKLGDVHGEGINYNNIGLVYYRCWGQYQKAVDYFQKALEVYREAGDVMEEATTLNNMGQVYQDWGQYQKALESHEKGLEIRKRIGDTRGVGVSLNDIGLVSANLGQDQKAIDYYKKSLEISSRIGDASGEDVTLNNLGQRLAALGRHEEALSIFRRSLEARKQMGLPTDWPNDLIGNLYLDMGRIVEAEPFLTEAGHNYSLGRLHFMKADFPAAKQYYEETLQYSERNRDTDLLFTAYTGLGKAHEALGDYGKAVEFYEKGIALVEEIRSSILPSQRNEFLSVKIYGFLRSDPAKGLTRVRLKLGEPEAALDSMEMTRARAFSDKLFARNSTGSSAIPIEVLDKEEALLLRLAVFSKDLQKTDKQESPQRYEVLLQQVREARANLKEFVDMLWHNYRDYAGVKYPRPLKLRDARIEDNEFVLFLDGTEQGVASVLVKGREIRKALFIEWKLSDLEHTVREFREPFAKFRPRAFDPALAHTIYERLLAPLMDEIAVGTPIIIVPDGILAQVPFEALIVRGSAKWKRGQWTEYPDGVTYLGDAHPVSYYQSMTALTLVREATKAKKPGDRLLVIADPVFDPKDDRAQAAGPNKITGIDEDYYPSLMAAIEESCAGPKFVRLPKTELLAHNLKKLYGSDCEDPYTGLKADKSYFLKTLAPRMDRYGLIVFATHGVLSERTPGLKEPFLALSMVPPGTDGFLRMSDVTSLSVNADLVALTACETGLGRELPGEGVMSMGRAFQYAGARSVLMSLWSVVEQSSVMLVEDFFKYRKSGKSKLESLKLARDDIRKEGFEHPFFWAPFILVGETN